MSKEEFYKWLSAEEIIALRRRDSDETDYLSEDYFILWDYANTCRRILAKAKELMGE